MLLLLPIQVESKTKSQTFPLANLVLILLNVLMYGRWPDLGLTGAITYAFCHASLPHLLVNVWVLWVFGNPVNRRLGNLYYPLAYLGSAAVLGLLLRFLLRVPVVGASGAIFAVIAICLLLMPGAMVRCLYLVVFPLTLLAGLLDRPRHWVFWLIRLGDLKCRALWGILLVPAMELGELLWRGGSWSNLGHLLGLVCGVTVVLILPARLTLRQRPALRI